MGQPSRVGHGARVLRRGLQVLSQCRARILAYHSVSDERTDCWSVGCRQFEGHMRLLRASGMTVVSLSELVQRLQLGLRLDRLVAITFDDGYCDFLEHAMPILRRYELPATVFVPVASLGGLSAWSQLVPDARIMSASQLEQVLNDGFAVGSHTMTHCRLVAVPDDHLQEEVSGSRRWLQERFGMNWMGFAYPFGDFGRRERRAVQAAGYNCAVNFGGLWGNGPETNLFELNRDAIKRACNNHAFQMLLSGWSDWVMAARLVGQSGGAVRRTS